jgi:hypothetical protein
MTKPTDAKTHFEQVPLEIVKKIAEEEIRDDETSGAGVTVPTNLRQRKLNTSAFQVELGECPVRPISRHHRGLKVNKPRGGLRESY